MDPEAHSHPLDRQTDRLLEALRQELGGAPVYQGGILFTGRAAEVFGEEMAQGKGLPQGPCQAAPWWSDGHLDTTDLLIYEPGGYLTKGCGIAIGNVKEIPVRNLVEGYRAWEHPIFSVLLREGPLGLGKLAQEYGYQLKEHYADRCHLCYEARKVLAPYFPEYLQPERHYGIRV